jgi:2'-deoxycytidine 5'-triphosphate deaminase (DCD)
MLAPAERVSIPPSYAAEMLPYDPTAGELRTHYAGFFDPGFDYSALRRADGRGGLAVELKPDACETLVGIDRPPVCDLVQEDVVVVRPTRLRWSK